MKKIAQENTEVKCIRLSRNFGQHNAITAGLKNSTGDWIVVMDCDLQDRPEEIKNLYQKTHEGYQVVVGIRSDRKDNVVKRISSFIFYFIFSNTFTLHFFNKIFAYIICITK